jgi:predicted nucleic acid-binding protein
MLAGEIPFAISAPVVLEYESVLKRPGILGEAPWIRPDQIDGILDALRARGKPVDPWFHFRPFLDDPKDDAYIDCALAGGASVILSGDRAFSASRRGSVRFARAVGGRIPQRATIRRLAPEETIMSGFALRVPDHVLAQAKAAAAEEHVSINQLLVSLISEGLGHRRGLLDLRERAARADVTEALRTLDHAPDAAPDEGDELPA